MGFLQPDLPELTRLSMAVHTADSGARTLTVSFLVHTSQLLLEDFEAAAHDAVLKHAHAAGHMPVGPILITTEPASVVEQKSLEEGRPMLRSFDEMALDNAIRAGDLVQVKASVELGLSLA